jgi:hypothetical protein
MGDRDLASVFYMWIFSFPNTVEKAGFSPMYVFGSILKNQMSVAVWAYFWIFYSILLVCVPVFFLVPCCFLLLWLYRAI